MTHQLVTRVLATFLKVIFDFDNIDISDELDNLPAKWPHEKAVEYATLIELRKESAINLAVWVSPDSHVIFPDAVIQGGSLSDDLFRYGLFMMKDFGPKSYSYKDFQKDDPNYRNTIDDFSLDKPILDQIEKMVENNSNSIFKPQHCISKSEP